MRLTPGPAVLRDDGDGRTAQSLNALVESAGADG